MPTSQAITATQVVALIHFLGYPTRYSEKQPDTDASVELLDTSIEVLLYEDGTARLFACDAQETPYFSEPTRDLTTLESDLKEFLTRFKV